MKAIYPSLVFIIFASLGLSSQAQNSTRHIWIYFPDVYVESPDEQRLDIEIFQNGSSQQTYRLLSHENEWYSFTYTATAEEAATLILTWKGAKAQTELPPGDEDIYVSFKNQRYFPDFMEVWTRSQVLARLSRHRAEIEGNISIPTDRPFDLPTHVKLHLPFSPDKKGFKNIVQNVRVLPTDDWREARFRLAFYLPSPGMAFLEVGNRFYPLLVRPNHHYVYDLFPLTKPQTNNPFSSPLRKRLNSPYPLVQLKDGKDFDQDDVEQAFFNHRYPYGLDERQYHNLTKTLRNAFADRSDTLMTWAHGILPFIEKRGQDPHRLLNLINSLGVNTSQQQFVEAFREELYREEVRLDEMKNKWEMYLITVLILTLILFVLAVGARLLNPKGFMSKRLQVFEGLLHGSFWILIAFTLSVEIRSGVLLVSNPLNILFLLATASLFYVSAYYIVPRILIKKRWKLFFISFLGLILAFVFTYALFNVNPLKDFYWIKTGEGWRAYVKSNNLFEDLLPPIFIISTFFAAPVYGLLRNLLLTRVPLLQQQRGHLKAELKALKTQIRPHFFFNSLNTVYSYALGENSPRTAEAITKLSDMMRFVIYHGDKAKVKLEEEIAYLEDYVELQELRLDKEKHDLHFRITGDAGDLSIAPLILITPIENAFKHGISMSRPSFIYIDLLIQEEGVILTVENSVHPGQLLPVAEKEEGGLGLVNTRQRLDLLYAGRYEWFTEAGDDRYFTQLSLDLK